MFQETVHSLSSQHLWTRGQLTPAEKLHPEEGEDEYEEGEEQEEREDGAYGVHERDHEVAEVRPILGNLEYPGKQTMLMLLNSKDGSFMNSMCVKLLNCS